MMKETLDHVPVVEFDDADVPAIMAACTVQLCDLLRSPGAEDEFVRLYVGTHKLTQMFGFQPGALDDAMKTHLVLSDPSARCTRPPDVPSNPTDLDAYKPEEDPASAVSLAGGVYIISTSEECNCNGGPTHRKVSLRGGSEGQSLLTHCCEWALWLWGQPVGPAPTTPMHKPDVGTWRWFRKQGVNLTEPPQSWLDTLNNFGACSCCED
jgi:hypothetical protein